MSGGIDPLLPGDDEADGALLGGARVSSAVDLTALFDVQRARLVRLAAAITLDRALAEEIAQESLVALQKRIGHVADPTTHLLRSVVRIATSGRLARRREMTQRRRRQIEARRPDPVAPLFDRADLAATWAVIATLGRHRRAVLVLVHGLGLDEAQAAEVLGRRRHRVAAELHAAMAAMQEVAGGWSGPDPPDVHVERTLAVALPQLVGGGDVGAADQIGLEPIDPTPSGTTSLRLFVPKEPKRHRFAWGLGVVLLVGAVVAAVAVFSQGQGDVLTDANDRGTTGVAAVAPVWYDAIRPYVPEEFDRLALVALEGDHLAFVAIDTASGRSLDIDIVGRDVDVRCDLCTETAATWLGPADLQVLSTAIGAGFVPGVGDRTDGFGAPSPLRTDRADVAAAFSATFPDDFPDTGDTAVTETASASGPGTVQALGTPDRSVSVVVVHGAFPAPSEVLRPPMSGYADVTTGWVVDPDGTATRIVIPTDIASGRVPQFEELLDALGDVRAHA